MSQATKTTSKKKALWFATAAAVAAAVGGAALFAALTGAPGKPLVSSIPDLVPADADTVVVAPYGPDWWEKLTDMAPPETRLSGTVPEDGLQIEAIGYSRSPDPVRGDESSGPLRLFYVESPDAASAAKVAGWLGNNDGTSHGRSVNVLDDVVVVAENWAPDYKAPEVPVSKVKGYDAKVTEKAAAMWMNVDKEIDSLVPEGDTKTAEVLSNYMRKGLGFTEGTTWNGTSTDGENWGGHFATGGVDERQLDFPAVTAELQSLEEIVFKQVDGNKYTEIVDAGVGEILFSAVVSAPSQGADLGNGDAAPVESVDNPVVEATSDVTEWAVAAGGPLSTYENISKRSISANANDMSVSLAYSERR